MTVEEQVAELLEGLQSGSARRLESTDLDLLLTSATCLLEVDSLMTGPIRVLALSTKPDRWVLEFDTRRHPVLRRLSTDQSPEVFIAERRAAYERMWDG